MSRPRVARAPVSAELSRKLAEIGRRIEESKVSAAAARWQMNATFDPGYLYVIEFDSGVVKVGKARDADSRLSAHAKTGLVRASWVSLLHLHCKNTERELITRCAERGSVFGGREYFQGVDHSWACDTAGEIVDAALRRSVADGDIPHGDLAAIRKQIRAEALAVEYRDMVHEMHENFGRTVAQIDATVDAMLEGADGDLDANAVEAWKRASGVEDEAEVEAEDGAS